MTDEELISYFENATIIGPYLKKKEGGRKPILNYKLTSRKEQTEENLAWEDQLRTFEISFQLSVVIEFIRI